MPVRKLQDLDEKTRGQVHTEGLLSITTEWVERLGSSASIMTSARERAAMVLLSKSSTFTESLILSREVDD